MSISVADLSAPYIATLQRTGSLFLPGAHMRPWLESIGSLQDWPDFAASWERLPEDRYMGDGGHYRHRRHAVYTVDADGRAGREPHQPHYQSRDYNPLNGGVQRWFGPIEKAIGAGQSMATVLRLCALAFGNLAPDVPRWRCEVHQFRIEPGPGATGRPTPEGMHRDGVDYVLVLLVQRRNIVSGTTSIRSRNGEELGHFTLAAPFDASLLDDARVLHGVTPVQAHDPQTPACRDVLVVTLRRGTPGA
ncbi:MAG TPA: 2OG-Fe dioxygenase family protein [Nevskiaceae bacterium]|nr:2OG-Fe dioxygenase family protein [Nevskiaceae bacterium]